MRLVTLQLLDVPLDLGIWSREIFLFSDRTEGDGVILGGASCPRKTLINFGVVEPSSGHMRSPDWSISWWLIQLKHQFLEQDDGDFPIESSRKQEIQHKKYPPVLWKRSKEHLVVHEIHMNWSQMEHSPIWSQFLLHKKHEKLEKVLAHSWQSWVDLSDLSQQGRHSLPPWALDSLHLMWSLLRVLLEHFTHLR